MHLYEGPVKDTTVMQNRVEFGFTSTQIQTWDGWVGSVTLPMCHAPQQFRNDQNSLTWNLTFPMSFELLSPKTV